MMSTREATLIALGCSLLLLLPDVVLCQGLPLPVMTGPVIGIDFGTTHSCVGVLVYMGRELIRIIPDDQDHSNRIIPNLVAFTDSEPLVGDAARNQSTQYPELTISHVKRLIGRKFDDPEVQKDLKFLPYKVVNMDGKPYIQVKVKGEIILHSPEEIISFILYKMKQMAESYSAKKINEAVITVPVYFSDEQKQATRDAGKMAGLNVVNILNDPTAAVMAYQIDKKYPQGDRIILVFHLGGATLDVTILVAEYGEHKILATSGDAHLGGEDFNNRLMDYFIKLIKKKHGKDIRKDSKALWKLNRECERAKRALSNQHQVRLEIESLFDGVNFSEPLTRARFEELNMDLFKKTLGVVEKVLADANLTKSKIDDILLVGGSTRIPKVQELLKDMFNGKEPCRGLNPDEAVAYGAAIQGAIFSGPIEDEINNLDAFLLPGKYDEFF